MLEIEKINEDEIIIAAQFNKDRKLCTLSEKCFAIKDKEVYHRVCSGNFRFCRSFLENKPISEEDYESGNYVIESLKEGEMFVLSGGAT